MTHAFKVDSSFPWDLALVERTAEHGNGWSCSQIAEACLGEMRMVEAELIYEILYI